MEAVALQGQALPLGQGVYHLGVGPHIRDIKAHRALHAVEIIIQAGVVVHKEGRGYTAQIQRLCQIDLEIALDELNGTLHFIAGQRSLVAGGNDDLAHDNTSQKNDAPIIEKNFGFYN